VKTREPQGSGNKGEGILDVKAMEQVRCRFRHTAEEKWEPCVWVVVGRNGGGVSVVASKGVKAGAWGKKMEVWAVGIQATQKKRQTRKVLGQQESRMNSEQDSWVPLIKEPVEGGVHRGKTKRLLLFAARPGRI